jgi:hypothetical protein
MPPAKNTDNALSRSNVLRDLLALHLERHRLAREIARADQPGAAWDENRLGRRALLAAVDERIERLKALRDHYQQNPGDESAGTDNAAPALDVAPPNATVSVDTYGRPATFTVTLIDNGRPRRRGRLRRNGGLENFVREMIAAGKWTGPKDAHALYHQLYPHTTVTPNAIKAVAYRIRSGRADSSGDHPAGQK